MRLEKWLFGSFMRATGESNSNKVPWFRKSTLLMLSLSEFVCWNYFADNLFHSWSLLFLWNKCWKKNIVGRLTISGLACSPKMCAAHLFLVRRFGLRRNLSFSLRNLSHFVSWMALVSMSLMRSLYVFTLPICTLGQTKLVDRYYLAISNYHLLPPLSLLWCTCGMVDGAGIPDICHERHECRNNAKIGNFLCILL